METNTTINIFWLILAALTLLIAVIASIVKSNREAERYESWLKSHEKEIEDLKRNYANLTSENKSIRDIQTNQNNNFINEIRKVESLMSEIKLSNGIIHTKLEMLLSNGTKNQNQS